MIPDSILSTQTMALEELPHDTGRVDLQLRPCVAKAIDANHANFYAVGTSLITHGGQRTRRVLENNVPFARVVACPACESIGNALQPLRASASGLSVVR